MHKFNRFAVQFYALTRFRGWLVVLMVGLAMVACAHHPDRSAPASTASASDSTLKTHPLTAVADVAKARQVEPELGLRQHAPLHYVVKQGDTLWDIAGYYLEDPWKWPVLWYDNPQIHNPHLIYPGDVLELVWVKGHPRLTFTSNTEHLHPRVRSEPLAQATPAIPFDAIRSFLQGPRVVEAEEIEQAPYVIAFAGEHLVGAAGVGVFVKNLPSDPAAHWQIVHIGKAYRDPDTNDLLGYEAIPTASVVVRKAGHPAKLFIADSQRETLIGDRLLQPLATHYHASFVPHPPKKAVDGSIIAVFKGLSQIGQHAIVTLDRGSQAGLDAGTVLRIMRAARSVRDPHGGPDSHVVIPPQPAGLMMVFETTPHLSYALVMKITQSVHVLDRFANPKAAEQ